MKGFLNNERIISDVAEVNEFIADAVMDRPRELFVENERIRIWSPTLGMAMMLERRIRQLGIDQSRMTEKPALEALRLVKKNRWRVCDILSILSYRKYEELCDSRLLNEKAEWFGKNLSDTQLAQLLLLHLTSPTAEMLMEMTGVSEENRQRSMVTSLGNRNGNTRFFGGKTIYGALIEAACRAFGWTKQYVVWEIDLVSLRMMMADAVTSVYLPDEQLRKLHLHERNDIIDANNPDNTGEILAMDWK